ncbi:hypothetical protein GCM10027275_22880 [Rhabdobacter roseus]|uniref:Uncharacterized protein n=1 Tax=Rhabdobacter roseus TaxID=1655419 RepID=A0A840TJ53_9BACT|nr:hypothetical protein [Rhabdobacter roseus]MBB5284226.1 hypothetical protein [Rhabdobacter roseus]
MLLATLNQKKKLGLTLLGSIITKEDFLSFRNNFEVLMTKHGYQEDNRVLYFDKSVFVDLNLYRYKKCVFFYIVDSESKGYKNLRPTLAGVDEKNRIVTSIYLASAIPKKNEIIYQSALREGQEFYSQRLKTVEHPYDPTKDKGVAHDKATINEWVSTLKGNQVNVYFGIDKKNYTGNGFQTIMLLDSALLENDELLEDKYAYDHGSQCCATDS